MEAEFGRRPSHSIVVSVIQSIILGLSLDARDEQPRTMVAKEAYALCGWTEPAVHVCHSGGEPTPSTCIQGLARNATQVRTVGAATEDDGQDGESRGDKQEHQDSNGDEHGNSVVKALQENNRAREEGDHRDLNQRRSRRHCRLHVPRLPRSEAHLEHEHAPMWPRRERVQLHVLEERLLGGDAEQR